MEVLIEQVGEPRLCTLFVHAVHTPEQVVEEFVTELNATDLGEDVEEDVEEERRSLKNILQLRRTATITVTKAEINAIKNVKRLPVQPSRLDENAVFEGLLRSWARSWFAFYTRVEVKSLARVKEALRQIRVHMGNKGGYYYNQLLDKYKLEAIIDLSGEPKLVAVKQKQFYEYLVNYKLMGAKKVREIEESAEFDAQYKYLHDNQSIDLQQVENEFVKDKSTQMTIFRERNQQIHDSIVLGIRNLEAQRDLYDRIQLFEVPEVEPIDKGVLAEALKSNCMAVLTMIFVQQFDRSRYKKDEIFIHQLKLLYMFFVVEIDEKNNKVYLNLDDPIFQFLYFAEKNAKKHMNSFLEQCDLYTHREYSVAIAEVKTFVRSISNLYPLLSWTDLKSKYFFKCRGVCRFLDKSYEESYLYLQKNVINLWQQPEMLVSFFKRELIAGRICFSLNDQNGYKFLAQSPVLSLCAEMRQDPKTAEFAIHVLRMLKDCLDNTVQVNHLEAMIQYGVSVPLDVIFYL